MCISGIKRLGSWMNNQRKADPVAAGLILVVLAAGLTYAGMAIAAHGFGQKGAYDAVNGFAQKHWLAGAIAGGGLVTGMAIGALGMKLRKPAAGEQAAEEPADNWGDDFEALVNNDLMRN